MSKVEPTDDKYDTLVDKLTILLHKGRATANRWEIGKAITNFMNDTIIPVNYKEITKKLANSIDMSPSFWYAHIRFYRINPNGEYKEYKWWVCSILMDTKRSARKILTVAYDEGLIKDTDDMRRWSDIIERRKLSPVKSSLLDLLEQGDETIESLAKKAHTTRKHVSSKISELNECGYIIKKIGLYHLTPSNNEDDIRKLSRKNSSILKVLYDGDESVESLARKAHISKNSLSYQLSCLRRLHRYNISYKWSYHLVVSNDDKRKKIVSDIKAKIKKCGTIQWSDVDIITLPRVKKIPKNAVLSAQTLENLDGLLLGDGSMGRNGISGWYGHVDKNPSYIDFLGTLLTHSKIVFRKTFDMNANGKHSKKKYMTNRIVTKYYGSLLPVYARFYLTKYVFCPYCEILFHQDENYNEWQNRGTKQNGRKKKKGKCLVCPVCEEHYLQHKVIPLDIEITPTMLRRWYEGDGTCRKIKSKNSVYISSVSVCLATCAFLPDHTKLLIKKFHELGIECKYGKNSRSIQISKKSEAKKFFEYMGNCEVDCYKYKWCSVEELRYQRTSIDWELVDWDDVKELHETGVSWGKIGKKYDIRGATMIGKSKQLGLEIGGISYEKSNIDWKKVNWKKVFKSRKAGILWKQIGEEYGISNTTLRRKVKSIVSKEEFSQYQKPPIDWSGLDLVDILKLRKAGILWDKIGEKYGFSGDTLRWKVEKMVSKEEFLKYKRPLVTPDERKERQREWKASWSPARKAEYNAKALARYYKNKPAQIKATSVKQSL